MTRFKPGDLVIAEVELRYILLRKRPVFGQEGLHDAVRFISGETLGLVLATAALPRLATGYLERHWALVGFFNKGVLGWALSNDLDRA